MKTAKLGTIFVVSVMALAAVGGAYALWFQDLTIDVEINTGEFKVGVRDDGTGDPGPNYLMGGKLFPDPADPETEGTADPNHEPGCNEEGKNVASTISVQGEPNFIKDSVKYYHNIFEYVYNAYPWYASSITITFANGGTVPAKINHGYWSAITGTDLTSWLAVGDVYIIDSDGTHGPYDEAFLNGFQYQLDPCHTVQFVIHFYFMEENTAVELLPQGATMGFTYYIQWAQWNEVPGAVTPLT